MRRPVYLELEVFGSPVVNRVLIGYENDYQEAESLELPPMDDTRWRTDPRYRGLLDSEGRISLSGSAKRDIQDAV